ncbi:MAG: alginate lyase family protein [Bacteroidota bacterium]
MRLLATALLLVATPLWAQADELPAPDPASLVTVADVVEAYPDRIVKLIEDLELVNSALAGVAAAEDEKDLVGAAEALLAYYRDSPEAAWVAHDPLLNNPIGYDRPLRDEAYAVLRDTLTLQGVTGPITRTADGTIDWMSTGPRDDFQWRLFLNRHYGLLVLARTYRETEDTALAAAASAFVTDWVVSNPIPGPAAGERALPRPWWPMTVTSRLLEVWPQAFYALQDEPAFTDAARLLMLMSVQEQVTELLAYHRTLHNHGTKEMVGLAFAAVAFPEFKRADGWFAYAEAMLVNELAYQVFPDGVHKELSMHYHSNALRYFSMVKRFADETGRTLSPSYADGLEAMAAYQAWALRPDGHGLLNNNGDRDFLRDDVLTNADRFDQPAWRYIATNGAEGAEPEGLPSRFYGWPGHLLSRSGWDADAHWSAFDIGPWGSAHQHNDRLHLSVAAFGRDLLVDTGRWRYVRGDPYLPYFRGSYGHNVVLVDGHGQGPQAEAFDAPITEGVAVTDAYDFALGTFGDRDGETFSRENDGSGPLVGEAVHTRAVAYVRGGYWLVVDRVETDRPRTLTALWHFHPDNTVETDGTTAQTANARGNLAVVPLGGPAWTLELVEGRDATDTEPAQGWWSREYNHIEEAPAAVYTAEVDGTATFAWLLAPSEAADTAPPTAEVLRDEGPIRIAVTHADGTRDELAVDLDAGTFTLMRDGTLLGAASN